MSRILVLGLLMHCLTMVCSAVDEPAVNKDAEANAATDRYENRPDHDPNGIGKFYMGREIAHVMGFAGAEWLERSTREEEERLTLLVRSLHLKPGEVVADIGAGSGVISMRMAELLLPDGKVMAVDVQQEMLDRLKTYCDKFGIKNVEPVKGSQNSTGLKPASVEMAIMVDVYHEFEFPYEMMADISNAGEAGRTSDLCGIPKGRPNRSDQGSAQNVAGSGSQGGRTTWIRPEVD